VIELYTHLRNRLGLNLIMFDEFNHVDFLYSRNVSDMVYNSVIRTISKVDLLGWVPVYDNTVSFYALKTDNQCNDSELHERSSRRKKNGFWSKFTSIMEKMEVQPIISTE
jgi:hypothetical protein